MAYLCVNCGYSTPGWLGRCPQCGEWNSFLEEKPTTPGKKNSAPGQDPLSLQEIEEKNLAEGKRLTTGFMEVDRVLGGGIVEGSLVLLSGDPGIGKSTLLLKVAYYLSQKGEKVLYVSSEESLYQLYIRIKRLIIPQIPSLFLLSTSSFEELENGVKKVNPSLVVVDSIQNMLPSRGEFLPGGVAAVRDLSLKFMEMAKRKNIALFIVGHVTKEGTVAGPRTLEHLVDVVLYLEGEPQNPLRILRGTKNRFGSTQEVGLMEMREEGLFDLIDPSHYFVAEDQLNGSGTARTVLAQGKRSVVVEVQSLVNPSYLGFPRRVSLGIDLNRLHLLLAVVEKTSRVKFFKSDVYLSIVGGIKAEETASDLAACFSLVSSRVDRPLDKGTIFLGEVGLGGELRPVPLLDSRIQEASRIGIKRVVTSSYFLQDKKRKHHFPAEIQLIGYPTIQSALKQELDLG